VIDCMLAELRRELALAGVEGGAAKRPLAEARDHLAEAAQALGETAAITCFGSPRAVARRIAVEIAPRRTCAAALASFAALAASGIVYLVVLGLGTGAGSSPDVASGRTAAVGVFAALVVLVAPQVAFVAGCLAVMRAWRLHTLPGTAPELALLRRRSVVALAAGAVAMIGLALYAYELGWQLAAWWTPLAVTLCGGALVPMGLAWSLVARSSRPVAAVGAPAGDLFDDLAPVLDRLPWLGASALRTHATVFVLAATAVVCAAAVAVRWHAEGDPGSGLVAGVFESVAFLGAYLCLRGPLGLFRPV
jgi:hypothetical protein